MRHFFLERLVKAHHPQSRMRFLAPSAGKTMLTTKLFEYWLESQDVRETLQPPMLTQMVAMIGMRSRKTSFLDENPNVRLYP